MAGQDYLDAVWDAVPEGAQPEAFAERRAFLLEHVRAGARVLDVGCGEGWFSAAMAGAGAVPVAVDVADEPLRRLRERFPQIAHVLRAEAGRPLPLDDGEADVVWAGEVIEHVVDAGAFASELRRVVRPGGTILVTTPDHSLRTRLGLLSARRFEAHFAPYADHLRFFTRRTLRDVLGEGTEVTATNGRLYAVTRR